MISVTYVNSSREGEKSRADTGSPPRTQNLFHKASREDSGYENGIIGESRACRGGGKWITFRKKHREKRLGDEVDLLLTFLTEKPCPRSYTFYWQMVTLSLPTRYGQKSWDTLAFLGRFPIHTGPTLCSPHEQSWTRVSRIFFRVSTSYRMRGGGRENYKKFRKGSSVLWGNQEMAEKYEYGIIVPRTFVHDCGLEHCIPFNSKCAVL